MLNRIQRSATYLSNYFEPVIGLVSPQYRATGTKAKVLGLREESSDMYTLTLKPSALAPFSFKPGQHISVQTEINGRAYLRTFSISSPLQQWEDRSIIELSIKRIPGGIVTNWIPEHLTKGAILRISEAQGTFTFKPQKQQAQNAFIACGSGITPILSILESLPKEQLSRQHLLYSVSHITTSAFTKRLQSLANRGLSLKVLETSSEGRFNADILDTWLDRARINNVFTCGPEGLADLACELFEQRSTRLEQATPEFLSESFGFQKVEANTDINVSFKSLSGNTVTAKQTNGTLLENAELQGLKPLYGCRAGICHQCIAKKTSGRVRNTQTNEISEAGEEDIQLCICVAETDVKLSINERSGQ